MASVEDVEGSSLILHVIRMNLSEWFRVSPDVMSSQVTSLTWKPSPYPRPGGSSGAFEVEASEGDYRALLKPGRPDPQSLPRCQAAVERIAFVLGNRLDLPIPPVQLTKGFPPAVADWPCCIAFKPKGAVWTWGYLQAKGALSALDKNLFQEGARIVPFHIWIDAHDRANQGNILYVENPESGESRFFFIDHSTSMLGAEQVGHKHWREGRPLEFVQCAVFAQFLEQISSLTASKTIDKIANLSDNEIREAVLSIPEEFLTSEEKCLTIEGLLQRKGKIRELVKRWFENYGKSYD